jgi:dipeptidyl aminopeptidase/acylaminoacyl peptidase
LAGSLVVPVADRLGSPEPAGPGEVPSLPDQLYPVPLHAPSVGEGAALGQPAAYLLGGVARADGWSGQTCCHLAVVGASTDEYAFLDLPATTGDVVGGESGARLRPDGRVVAYATAGGGVRMLDLVEGTIRTVDAPPGRQVWSVLAWSGDGTRIAVATGDRSVGGTDEFGLATVTVADQPSWSTPDLGVRWNGSTNAVALAPDGAQIALAQAGELRVAPVDGGSARILLSGIGPEDHQVAWSPDGERIAVLGFAGRRDQGVAPEGSGAAWFKGRYVEVATGRPGLFDIERGYELIAMLGFSGNSHLLVSVSPSSGSGPYAVERYELTTADRSIVTRLSDGIDPQQIGAPASLLDTSPRASAQPSDGARAIAPVGVLAALVVLAAVLMIGRLGRRRALH